MTQFCRSIFQHHMVRIWGIPSQDNQATTIPGVPWHHGALDASGGLASGDFPAVDVLPPCARRPLRDPPRGEVKCNLWGDPNVT